MYGTVARMRVRPGAEEQLMGQLREFQSLHVPGFKNNFVYHMDNEPQEYYLVVIFESREAYWANAKSAEQDARYQQMAALLEAPPDWHDGEIIFSVE